MKFITPEGKEYDKDIEEMSEEELKQLKLKLEVKKLDLEIEKLGQKKK